MSKKKKTGIIIICVALFLFFLIPSTNFTKIPAWVYSDKNEYTVGENVELYGFLIQGSLGSCSPLFEDIYDSEGKKFVVEKYVCLALIKYFPPMKLYTNTWDQTVFKNFSSGGFEKELVKPGEYTLIYMEQKIPITINP